ncbi:tripartite ATP-independent transporter solute receptor, DctP family [Pseudorhodobacter antarcticus]|uniref:Tripartite ATP-independent transporter solute receptor, DctP family n=1 Tax=Pseudorhodobacter antarcticus TaxID=1077947 RepID=A0A1H8KPD9_9RHOB|nr:TRAP transporter substrate-binding protein [Pseudorhodobacter antarcticus]SEN94268.1 tripartite ATP-independent transporter solute receptor, DctP family [Pseudorhodobacter antarcticus]
MKSLRNGVSATLMVCAVSLSAAPAVAETYIVAVGAPSNSLQGRSAAKFAEDLQAELGDAHIVEFYADAQLGDEKELMQKLRLGTVQFTLISSIMTNVAPEFALFDMPFLVKDRAHLKAIDAEIVQTDLAPKAEETGLKVLSTWENGFRQITNSTRPINTPADLQGLKIRTPSSEWRVAMFKEWGANPTPMSFSEVFVALQTGTMDGQENPLTNITGANFQEVQKYLSLTGHVYSPSYLTTGLEVWNNLPEDVQSAVRIVAASVQEWSLEEGESADNELVDKVKAAGMEVNEVDKDTFIEASAPIYKAFADQVEGGEELVSRAQALAK